MVGWAAPHGRRSSWEIIWSCLSIFIVCSWRCLHLNLPTEEESRAGWHQLKIHGSFQLPYFPERPLLTKWRRKLVWMAVICLAPEVGVGLAARQWTDARKHLRRVNNGRENAVARLSMAHALYAAMGAVVIRRPQTSSLSGTQVWHNAPTPPDEPVFIEFLANLGMEGLARTWHPKQSCSFLTSPVPAFRSHRRGTPRHHDNHLRGRHRRQKSFGCNHKDFCHYPVWLVSSGKHRTSFQGTCSIPARAGHHFLHRLCYCHVWFLVEQAIRSRTEAHPA